MKKVLICAYDFLPYSSSFGACARMFKLATFLQNRGYKVFVLSSKGVNVDYFGFEDQARAFTCLYVDDPFKATKDRAAGIDQQSGFGGAIVRLKSFVKRLLIPDARRLLVPRFSAMAQQLIKDEQIQNVIISSPPHSIQLVGLRLRKKFGNSITLIVDYRDSWNMVKYFQRRSAIARKISEKIERKILRNCDYYTYVSEPIGRKLQQYLQADPTKGKLVMNGFLGEAADNTAATKSDKIILGYFGSMVSSEDSYRNIRPLLQVIEQNRSQLKGLEVHLYGEIQILNYNLDGCDFVKIFPTMTLYEAQEQMKLMDGLLIIHSDRQSSEEVITGKFFDYLKSGRPVVVYSDPNMEAYKLVAKNSLGFVIDNSTDESITEGLKSMVRAHGVSAQASIDVNTFSADVQFGKLEVLLS